MGTRGAKRIAALDPLGTAKRPAQTGLRSAAQVQKSLFAYLKKIKTIGNQQPGLQPFSRTIQKTTLSYAPGLFHCYDMPGLPRANNARESDFRDLNRRDLYDLMRYLSDRKWPAPNLDLLNNASQQTGWAGEPLSSKNWREAARKKVESTPWEQAVDDVRPFIASADELGRLTKENLLNLLR